MAIVTHEQFKNIRKKHKDNVLVYVSGTFDLLHANHIIFFEKAKQLGNCLIVGVGPDTDVKKNKKGTLPILNQDIRLKMVDSLRMVDYCFLGKKMLKKGNPQTRVIEIFKQLRPNIYYLNNDASDIDFRKKVCQEYGVKMIISKPSKKYEGLTTSKIIAKIKNID